MSKIVKELQYGDHTLIIETGEIARQADGAVFVNMGGTQVLVTVVGKKDGAEKNSFFPLTINYQEKSYAAGKIPGGFNKREGRPSEHETLTARLIDRPLRPLFPEGFMNEVQVIATVMSLNPDVQADVVSMIGASAALAISGIPFDGPIGAARVGYQDGIYTLNPGFNDVNDSSLDLVVAGTEDAILMVESEAKELSEDVMLGAVMYGHEMMKSVIKLIKELASEVGKPRWDWQPAPKDQPIENTVKEQAMQDIIAAYEVRDKQSRYQKLGEIRQKLIEQLCAPEDSAVSEQDVAEAMSTLEKQHVREQILSGQPRIDGRDTVSVRPIHIKTKLLDRATRFCSVHAR